MIKYKSILFLLFLLVILTFSLRRSLVIPIYQKLKGKETINSVVDRINTNVNLRLRPDLQKLDLNELPTEIKLWAFKEEQRLEVYAKKNNKWIILKTYPFTGNSGRLGPKLKEGDRQIPEGIYEIESLNPNSSYHLSLKINFPNSFDKAQSSYQQESQLGSDIFIHGKNVTVGCIPIGDEGIEELFVLANHAIENKIEVIISPRDFRANPTRPNIEAISWEDKLYESIEEKLFSKELSQ